MCSVRILEGTYYATFSFPTLITYVRLLSTNKCTNVSHSTYLSTSQEKWFMCVLQMITKTQMLHLAYWYILCNCPTFSQLTHTSIRNGFICAVQTLKGRSAERQFPTSDVPRFPLSIDIHKYNYREVIALSKILGYCPVSHLKAS